MVVFGTIVSIDDIDIYRIFLNDVKQTTKIDFHFWHNRFVNIVKKNYIK